MLRIGITYDPSIELFYSGTNQTSIILFELFKNFDYKVVLVDSKNTGTKKVRINTIDFLATALRTDGSINPSISIR